MSLPIRECGLKLEDEDDPDMSMRSLPIRECGLKSLYVPGKDRLPPVTPYTGVWIEIG